MSKIRKALLDDLELKRYTSRQVRDVLTMVVTRMTNGLVTLDNEITEIEGMISEIDLKNEIRRKEERR